MALTWLFFVGITVAWIAFLIWRRQNSPAPAETPPPFAAAIISLVAGGFFFVAGAASYAILLATDCFTFNFKTPVWSGFKARLYFANIVVMTGFALGIGFGITPLVQPPVDELWRKRANGLLRAGDGDGGRFADREGLCFESGRPWNHV